MASTNDDAQNQLIDGKPAALTNGVELIALDLPPQPLPEFPGDQRSLGAAVVDRPILSDRAPTEPPPPATAKIVFARADSAAGVNDSDPDAPANDPVAFVITAGAQSNEPAPPIYERQAVAAKDPQKVLVISDFHMGITPDGRSSDFHFHDKKFAQYIRERIAEGYHLVFAGDVFECWETNFVRWKAEFASLAKATVDGESFHDWHESMGKPRFQAIRSQYPETFQLIETSGNITIISGNHDAVVSTKNLIPGATPFIELNINGRRVYIAHGHQADQYNAGRGWKETLGRLITCCVSLDEQLINKNIDIYGDALVRTIGLTHDDKEVYTVHAQRMAEKYGYDLVVYGHTHAAELMAMDVKVRANKSANAPKEAPKEKEKTRQMIYANSGRVSGEEDAVLKEAARAYRIDEVDILAGDDGTLIVTLQARWLDKGALNLKRSITMDSAGVCAIEELNLSKPIPVLINGDQDAVYDADDKERIYAARAAAANQATFAHLPCYSAGLGMPIGQSVQLDQSASKMGDKEFAAVVSRVTGSGQRRAV